MTPFTPDPNSPQLPYPPVDIPTPVTPSPDFATIAGAFAAAQTDAQKALAAAPGTFDWLWKQLLRWVGAVLGLLVDIASLLLAQVFKIFQGADPAINQLMNVVLAGMFGSSIQVALGTTVSDSAARQAASNSIAKVFTDALSSGQTPGAGLQPSDKGMNAFMQAAAHMAFEGWLLGWLAEAGTLGQMETFAELKDVMEASLGIGRMARRVMGPALKTYVEDPYTWLLNSTWHPTLLNPGECVRFYLRGGITRAGLQAMMDVHGYNSTLVDELIWDQVKQLSPADIETLRFHGDFDDAGAQKVLQRQGYDTLNSQLQLRAMQLNRYDAMSRRQCDEALGLLKSHRMRLDQYQSVIGSSALGPDEQDHYQKMGQMEVDYPLQFSMAEAELLFKKHLLNVTDLQALMTDYYHYSPAQQIDLELLMALEIMTADQTAAAKAAAVQARQQAAAAKAKAAAAKAQLAQLQIEEKGVSNAQYETLVEEGLRNYGQYYGYLVSKGIADDNATALVTVLGNKLAAKKAAAALKAAVAAQGKIKKLDVAQLETAVKQGLLSTDNFIARMIQLGMPVADAQLLGAEVQGQVDSAATKAKAAAAAKAQAAVKHVDLTQEERAVRLGIETIAQFGAFLDAHGFEPHDRDVLVAELQAQLVTDQQTAAKKSAAAQKLSQKGISLTQLERLVRAGVKTTDDYQAALATAGYDQSDQQAMTQFLQLQMDQDQQDLILHGHAAALVDQLGVSLADLERAVKLSVVPIATYQDALKRAGLSNDDQQTMVNNLVAEVKATRARQTTMQTVSKQVAAAGVSLTTLEKDTLAGKVSMPQFQGLLAGYGVSDTDIADVTQLVQDEIDNAQAVAALVAQAGARAAAKGLDLAQDTAAYKQGVMTEDEWRARVASLGYDAADVEILFETLAAAQAATAAKSAKKTTAVATPPATPAAGATAGG